MQAGLTAIDMRRIEKVIREKYAKAARSPEGLFPYPTGRAGAGDPDLLYHALN